MTGASLAAACASGLGGGVSPFAAAVIFCGSLGVYGLDRLRFPNPVKVDSRVRARRELLEAELNAPNTIQIKQRVTVEIEGEAKPGCSAETLSRLIYG